MFEESDDDDEVQKHDIIIKDSSDEEEEDEDYPQGRVSPIVSDSEPDEVQQVDEQPEEIRHSAFPSSAFPSTTPLRGLRDDQRSPMSSLAGSCSTS